MKLLLLAVLAVALVACVVVYGPCVVDKGLGRASCEESGAMVLVPGSTTLEVSGGASAPAVNVEKKP